MPIEQFFVCLTLILSGTVIVLLVHDQATLIALLLTVIGLAATYGTRPQANFFHDIRWRQDAREPLSLSFRRLPYCPVLQPLRQQHAQIDPQEIARRTDQQRQAMSRKGLSAVAAWRRAFAARELTAQPLLNPLGHAILRDDELPDLCLSIRWIG